MKFNYIFLILFSMQFIACSTSPYLKETELPKNTQYYSEEKQFKVKPEWYWRLRPNNKPISNWEATIGHKFIKDKIGVGLVIGEYKNDFSYYIIKWDNHGYFFIKKDDYEFAEKFKDYLIPLNYAGNSIFGYKEITSDELHYHLVAYYQSPSAQYVSDLPGFLFINNPRSGLNLTIISRIIIINSLLRNNYSFNSKYTEITKVLQISGYNGFTNQFLKLLPCPLLSKFTVDQTLNSIDYIATEQIGNTQYTNQYGLMFRGAILQSKYIILKWGKVFYALPTNNKE